MKTIFLALCVLAPFSMACGDDDARVPVTSSSSPEAGRGAEMDAEVDADAATMPEEDASPPPISACMGAPYTTSPSGAACDPKRILRTLGVAGACYGPPVGAVCDDMVVTVGAADVSEVAPGFVCDAPIKGKAKCTWVSDASAPLLDAAMLDAACATTAALPAAIVTCLVYGD